MATRASKSEIMLQYRYEDKTITHTFDADRLWPELCDEFLCFLRGCGLVFGDIEFREVEKEDE